MSVYGTFVFKRDFFLDKQREKAKLEAELKMQVTLKQVIPAGEAKTYAPLGIILPQYYINLNEFATHFNKESANWQDGVTLPVKVKKGLRAKEYTLFVNPPTMAFFIRNAMEDNSNYITVMAVWDIVRIKQKYFKNSFQETASLVLSVLKTCKIRKIGVYGQDWHDFLQNPTSI